MNTKELKIVYFHSACQLVEINALLFSYPMYPFPHPQLSGKFSFGMMFF